MKLLVAAVAFLSLVAFGSSLKCFICDSSRNDLCSDPFNATKATAAKMDTHTCSGGSLTMAALDKDNKDKAKGQCVKTRRTSANGAVTVSRSCGVDDAEDDDKDILDNACKTENRHGEETVICHCNDKELCNGAGEPAALGLAAAVASVLAARMV